MNERIPVWVDTDVGSDLDDALALLYLARHPRCELLGVTTVSGDAAKRAALARDVLDAAGRSDVPVRAGVGPPYAWGVDRVGVPLFDPRRTALPGPPGDAVLATREAVRARPGEVVLLTIGPFTNVGLLFALDPEVPALLRGMVSMAGTFAEGAVEWNAESDPASTAAVARRAAAMDWVPFETTSRCVLPREIARRRFAAPAFAPIRAMAERWFADSPHVVMHDPLAAATIFHPDLATWVRGDVLCPEDRPGATEFLPNPLGLHRVATEPDVEGFWSEFLRVVGGGMA